VRASGFVRFPRRAVGDNHIDGRIECPVMNADVFCKVPFSGSFGPTILNVRNRIPLSKPMPSPGTARGRPACLSEFRAPPWGNDTPRPLFGRTFFRDQFRVQGCPIRPSLRRRSCPDRMATQDHGGFFPGRETFVRVRAFPLRLPPTQSSGRTSPRSGRRRRRLKGLQGRRSGIPARGSSQRGPHDPSLKVPEREKTNS